MKASTTRLVMLSSILICILFNSCTPAKSQMTYSEGIAVMRDRNHQKAVNDKQAKELKALKRKLKDCGCQK